MQSLMVIHFFCFRPEKQVWGKLSLQAGDWWLDKFEYTEFAGSAAHFVCFRQEIPLFVKFDSKNQNCHFELKFGTQSNLKMQNSMLLLTFYILDQKYRFWDNFLQKKRKKEKRNVTLS